MLQQIFNNPLPPVLGVIAGTWIAYLLLFLSGIAGFPVAQVAITVAAVVFYIAIQALKWVERGD